MAAEFAYDGAFSRDLDAMVAHGAIAVTIYLTGSYAVPKSWVQQIHARGLGVVPNYEEAANELVYCGRPGGRNVGLRAMAAATSDDIPADGSVAILFSVDVNVQRAQFEQTGAAFDGINDAIKGRFLADAYGEGALIDYLIDTGRIQPGVKGWLSGSSSFPGFNPASPHIGLVQLIGSPVASTDQDKFTDPAGIHAWWPANSTFGGTMTLDAATLAQMEGVFSKLIQANNQKIHNDIAAMLSDPDHPYLPPLHTEVASVAAAATSASASAGQSVVRLAEIANAVDAHAAELKATLAAAMPPSSPAVPTSAPTAVDLSAVRAQLDALPGAVAAAVRLELASHPLTVTGAAS
jgi:hypothetical protein